MNCCCAGGRLARPLPNRFQLGVVLLAEFADVLTFTCALVILIIDSKNKDFNEKMGVAMFIAECSALIATIVDYLIIAFEIIIFVTGYLTDK